MAAPKARCFVDTNVWLYAFIATQDEQKSRVANDLLKQRQETVVVSTQVVNEACVNMLRKADADELTIRRLLQSFYHRYQVVALDESTLVAASELRHEHSFSYWDSVIVAAALAAGATILYSEDMQDQYVVGGTLTITNPFRTD